MTGEKEKLSFKQQLVESFEKLSTREKVLIISAAFVLGVTCLYAGYKPISRAFERQERTLAQLSSNAKLIKNALTRYLILKQRLDLTEGKFKRANLSARIRTHLEKLLEEQGRVPTGKYNIKRNAKRFLGREFELSPYTIKFDTTSLPNLISLLRMILHGSKPLLITKLDIQKSRRSDRLSVSIDVTSIRKISKERNETAAPARENSV